MKIDCKACREVGAIHCGDPGSCGALDPKVRCPCCGSNMALYFNADSTDYENSCPDCHAALVLSVTPYEGEV